MTKQTKKDADSIISGLNVRFKGKIETIRSEKHAYCVKKKETIGYWIRVDRDSFRDVVEYISDGTNPFLAVISGRDAGKTIELIYHFYLKPDIDSTAQCSEVGLNLVVSLPKNNPVIPTITYIIPGALLSELEKQEMLGVKIEGIGDEHAFLPENHPKGFYPWRKDQNA